MNDRVLRILEYDKIIDKLKGYAASNITKDFIDELYPMKDLEKIRLGLEETTQAKEVLQRAGSFSVGSFSDIKIFLIKASKGMFLHMDELLKISSSLRSAYNVRKNILSANDLELDIEHFVELADMITINQNLETSIESKILSETQMADDASGELKNIRIKIKKKNEAIKSKLNSIITSEENKKYLQDSIVTLRDDRYVIPVIAEHKKNVKGILHDRSSSGSTLYIEPEVIVLLNNELKELKLKELKEIERILKVLTSEVLEYKDELIKNQEILINVDFSIAKAKLSMSMNANNPEIINKKAFCFKNAKHPFLKGAIASDIYLGEDFEIMLITGPNTGGKTVTLKTTGILILMALSGLHIPCDEGSYLYPFEEVYVDIGDEQSIEQSLSTFSSHMKNIVNIIKNVDEKSLVLFDELGAGTDPTEGAALAMAILTELYNKQILAIATTHYSELKQYALVTEGVINACMEFDIKSLRPTYKLLIGVAGKSNAFEISRKLGLDKFIIQMAKSFIDKENVEFEDVLKSLEETNKLVKKKEEEIRLKEIEIIRLENVLFKEKENIKIKKEKVLTDAKEEANRILKRAKKTSEELIKELRNKNSDNKRIDDIKKEFKEMINETNTVNISKDIKEPVKSVEIGDIVFVSTISSNGEVLELPDSKDNVLVKVGAMKMSVNINKLQKVNLKKEENSKSKIKQRLNMSKTVSVKSSLDLRGKNYEEAIYLLDKYLDDVLLSSLENVTIIHGSGTLKSKLQNYYKRSKMIKSYRDGGYYEGQSGVTIITVKK